MCPLVLSSFRLFVCVCVCLCVWWWCDAISLVLSRLFVVSSSRVLVSLSSRFLVCSSSRFFVDSSSRVVVFSSSDTHTHGKGIAKSVRLLVFAYSHAPERNRKISIPTTQMRRGPRLLLHTSGPCAQIAGIQKMPKHRCATRGGTVSQDLDEI